MCATCVAQGAGYVGVSLGALRLMGARAAARRASSRAGREAAGPQGVDLDAGEPEPANA